MKQRIKDSAIFGAKRITLIAVMSATLIGGKLALSFLPNIEIVTLLCALYGYVFGVAGLAAVLIFVMCETFIWGVSTWVVSYLIYWPLVCLVFFALKKFNVANKMILTLFAVILTAFFGVLTSLIDVGLFMGFYDMFWQRFSIYYLRGVVYYIIHIVSNTACFLLLFKPLNTVLTRLKNNYFKGSPKN